MSARDIEAAWGGRAPEWVRVLAREAARVGQKKTGHAIGYSAATVSMVLRNCYGGDLEKVAAAVTGYLMPVSVECRALGTIDTARCLREQSMPFESYDPFRVRLYRACRNGCPHFKGDV
jgi:hypothetical protein